VTRTWGGSPPTCATCDAFKPNAASNPRSGEPRQGWCRAAPPIAIPIGQQAAALAGMPPALVTQGIWPPIMGNEWCRSWGPKEAGDA
jgi:hypothetical protein